VNDRRLLPLCLCKNIKKVVSFLFGFIDSTSGQTTTTCGADKIKHNIHTL
jgi:hypothetical protein